jgi:hypothetical protein
VADIELWHFVHSRRKVYASVMKKSDLELVSGSFLTTYINNIYTNMTFWGESRLLRRAPRDVEFDSSEIQR